ncbi:hypothetical protein, partial [Proteus mirabilis]|uniref:hypothetical protein n=1 Tax=Proteus mirabilis TaxID=584 RepID=UPI0034D74B7F
MSQEFGVDNELLLKANRLSDLDNTIYPDTTILVPLKTPPPNSPATAPSVPPSPLPSPPPPATLPPSSSSSKRTWLYA